MAKAARAFYLMCFPGVQLGEALSCACVWLVQRDKESQQNMAHPLPVLVKRSLPVRAQVWLLPVCGCQLLKPPWEHMA